MKTKFLLLLMVIPFFGYAQGNLQFNHRRVGNAVVRNQWKRRLREAFRQVRFQVDENNIDVIVVVRATGKPRAGQKAVQDMERDLVALIKRVISKIHTSHRGQATC